MSFSRAATVVALILVALTVRPSAQSGAAGSFVAGELLVKFRPGSNANARGEAHRVAGGLAVAEIQRTGVQRVQVPAGTETAAVARYQRNPNVEYAEPNFIRKVPRPSAHAEGSTVLPADYYFDEQWALHNTGQAFYCIPWPFGGELCFYSGTADADIDAPEAWAIFRGSASVSVAVIDSGVDYTHPDLTGNFAGGDDFVFNDGDPMDDHGHGTHVAGTIAAAMENLTGTPAAAEGVTGVAPLARILAYKVCRADGTCDDFAIQQAIARAITDGAKVINMSLGETAYSQSLDEAVQDAWTAGLVVVAGAGNNGTTDLFYPAALPNVISVAAFDEDHRRASFSNYGSWVDIAAPGTTIMSTYPQAACGSSAIPGDTGCYTWSSGTSMATPHVAGAAALVWARSDMTSNSQVVDVLLNSADGKGVAPGRLDSWTVHGGLNLHDAVSYGLANLPPLADAGPDQVVPDNDRDGTELVTLDGGASTDRDGSIANYAWREGGTLLATGATPAVWLAVGTHAITLEVTDDYGDSATDDLLVTVVQANTVTVAATTAQATEAGPGSGAFTVTRTGDTSVPLAVQYTVGGTALAGTDYLALPGAVTIEAGSSSAVVTVSPVDDQDFEADESVVLSLSAASEYSLGSPDTATVTIVSDDLPPDLAISAMTAPPTAGADTDISVTDTTKNQGTGTAPPSATGFYLSTNTTWDALDIMLGSRPVPQLAPGATHVQSTTVHVPPGTATGSYYVLAKADWDGGVNENLETNNVRNSGIVKIGPDLAVSALTAPASAAAGSTITVSDTTKNQGGGGASPSTTRFYLSTNGSLDASDVMLGNRSVPILTPGATDSGTTELTIPDTTATGTYWVIAQADSAAVVLETLETNNTRASGTVRIGPDLIVSALSAPSSAAPGASIVVTDTTKNQAAGTAPASATGFYLSANTSLSADDVFLGSRAVGTLASSAASSGSTTLLVPPDTASGTYYVIGTADWDNAIAETIETNNNRSSAAITIGGDLVLTAVSAPATGKADGALAVTDTIKNQGAVPVAASTTGFFLSLDGIHSESDVFLGSRGVGPLGPGATSSGSTQVVIPADTPPGLYRVLGVADLAGTVAEGNEANNVRSSGVVRVGPDLIGGSISAPLSAAAGTTITATDSTKNQGGDTAPASNTGYFLSLNAAYDAGDIPLAARPVPALAPGVTHSGSVAITIPASTAAGTYYIVTKADGDDAIPEAQETNNTRSRGISITAP